MGNLFSPEMFEVSFLSPATRSCGETNLASSTEYINDRIPPAYRPITWDESLLLVKLLKELRLGESDYPSIDNGGEKK